MLHRLSSTVLSLSLVLSCAAAAAGVSAQTNGQGVQEAEQLSQKVKELYHAGRPEEAIPLAQRALAIRERALGPEHPEVATALTNLAAMYQSADRYAEAEPLLQRALVIYEKALGPEHPLVGTAVNNLGALYHQTGRYAEAEPLLRRALAISEKALGVDHLDIAVTLNNFAALYNKVGRYAEAEPLLRRALVIQEKALGVEHPDITYVLNNMALLYRDTGRYLEAESTYRRALAVREKAFGSESSDVAVELEGLGALHLNTGRYAEAEPLLQRALAIQEKALGPEHHKVASTLGSLSTLYLSTGQYAKAELLLERVVSIFVKTRGPEDTSVATALNNLAVLYRRKWRYAEAERLYEAALVINVKALGPEHPEVAATANNLASIYNDTGRYDAAKALYQRALTIEEKAFGPESPHVAVILNNMAVLNRLTGQYAASEPLYQRALAIREKALGAEHPDVAQSLNNLGVFYQTVADFEKAGHFYERAGEVRERNLALILTVGSEQQKQLYLDTLVSETMGYVSFHVRGRPQDPHATRLALTTILRRKGRALDAVTDQMIALRRRAHPQDQILLDHLAATLSRLAALQFSNTVKLTPELRRAEISRLVAEQGRLEDNISRRSAEFRAVAQPVTLDAVRQIMPWGTALVELFIYEAFNPKAVQVEQRFGDPHYVAYILHRDEATPLWADLGGADDIDALVEQLRAALHDPRRKDFKQLARALDERVMRPIRRLLGDTRHVFLAPDGALNLIPFASLVDENGHYLVENYAISYLTSGRDLLRLQVTGEGREAPTVFADPLYDLTAGGPQPTPLTRANLQVAPDADHRRSKDFTAPPYRPLPGTAAEAAALQKVFPEATLLTRGRATEAALKRVNRPRLLHIATHGFFLTDQPRLPAANRARASGSDFGGDAKQPMMSVGENPLLRSGLILAGVKQQTSGAGEDGVLTALEAAGLDLWGTKLVVLSACETGLGDVKDGEGVYGLRRALVLAGSETQVMSLWKVSDAGTRDLMVAYYTRLQQGESRTEALRQIQLAMLQGKLLPSPKTTSDKQKGKRETGEMADNVMAKDYRHPYYWASFIPSGSWRNLTGQER